MLLYKVVTYNHQTAGKGFQTRTAAEHYARYHANLKPMQYKIISYFGP